MMETENDKLQSLQNSVSEDSSTREGGFQEGGFSARPRQRARIGQRAAYSSDRGPRQGYRPQRSTEDDGEFRPEGFGANLTSSRPQREEGGYQSRGGYQQRGGY
ncbi:MAG: pseudouridine synthase, partial [Prevotellaceae bacterium]|nr:pseudouridine synthase [Prevotellaceae bacterium]